MNLNGQKILVLGLGTSGLEAARLARRLGAQVSVVDEAQTNTLKEKGTHLQREGLR